MADESDNPRVMNGPVIQRLVKETGITEAEARELVSYLGGGNWSSLIREARMLKPKR
ncbi:hypothetical protein DBIPINDM_008163 (plasmid) [Mesorhizobium sp. AR02]|uniref:hypothetical protein n=1 Tax=Mesorhizobium sp. AR02 TaxID=2865837 RepID=UPI002160DE62|nr:hypothetical protein [Mesorhizobium sp. AR02]UVK57562.1 hypothetical protein DBIPINDM_008163 [Mesorhizobium sp. AR02]